MDSTLQALGGILLRAIPTLLLVILLHLYLKRMFFKPLEEVLGKRREATEGAREAAQTALRLAAAKAAEYEAALDTARAGIYKDQEETRRRWLEEQGRQIEEARRSNQALIAQAKQEITAQVAAAREELLPASRELAAQITQALLAGRRN